ncbi:MAG: YozE family protein [Clostridium neonatale]|uniref:YozE family protein n=1 Tax=Clostridium neonatale TaxID=137838 RepID=UPI00291B61BE|nr:YozE_SAM_like domain-containing protein [Clostridium neonatale]
MRRLIMVDSDTTFRQWIIGKCCLESSPRGDLARDISRDNNFPDTYDYSEMVDYLRYKRACPDAMNAFKSAYVTFIRLKGIEL